MKRVARPLRQKILCIDEDPAITTAIRFFLSRYELDVQAAADGSEGVAAAIREQPQVIIVDLRALCGDAGFVAENLKLNPQTTKIPLIVLSDRRDGGFDLRLQAMQISHCLLKPLQLEQLVNALAAFVELRSLARH